MYLSRHEMGIEWVRNLPTSMPELHLNIFESSTLHGDDSIRHRVPMCVDRNVLVGPGPGPHDLRLHLRYLRDKYANRG